MKVQDGRLDPLLLTALVDRELTITELSSATHSFDTILSELLHTIRVHLGLEVAFVSEFVEGRRIFRGIDSAQATESLLRVGESDPLSDSYCQRVIDGRLPELIQNAALYPVALDLPATTELPIGAHLSVPIKFSDGSVYGTFCCFSRTQDLSLNERDLSMMHSFAAISGRVLEMATARARAVRTKAERIEAVLESGSMTTVYQPIFKLSEQRIVGYESLARFQTEPVRSPDKWFAEAAEAGMGYQLECTAIHKALDNLSLFPATTYLSVNVSPATILACDDLDKLLGGDYHRIVLEMTEHSLIENYAELIRVLRIPRQQGLRLAVDDAGAGYASFRHILQLKPDIIKLDRSLISDIDKNRDQFALASALVSFANNMGMRIVAEGVETQEELEALKKLEVDKVQGYLVGRPAPIDELITRTPAFN